MPFILDKSKLGPTGSSVAALAAELPIEFQGQAGNAALAELVDPKKAAYLLAKISGLKEPQAATKARTFWNLDPLSPVVHGDKYSSFEKTPWPQAIAQMVQNAVLDRDLLLKFVQAVALFGGNKRYSDDVVIPEREINILKQLLPAIDFNQEINMPAAALKTFIENIYDDFFELVGDVNGPYFFMVSKPGSSSREDHDLDIRLYVKDNRDVEAALKKVDAYLTDPENFDTINLMVYSTALDSPKKYKDIAQRLLKLNSRNINFNSYKVDSNLVITKFQIAVKTAKIEGRGILAEKDVLQLLDSLLGSIEDPLMYYTEFLNAYKEQPYTYLRTFLLQISLNESDYARRLARDLLVRLTELSDDDCKLLSTNLQSKLAMLEFLREGVPADELERLLR